MGEKPSSTKGAQDLGELQVAPEPLNWSGCTRTKGGHLRLKLMMAKCPSWLRWMVRKEH